MRRKHEFTQDDFHIILGLNQAKVPYGYAVDSRLYYTGYPPFAIPKNDNVAFLKAKFAAELDDNYSVPEDKKNNYLYLRGYGYSALSNCYTFGINVEKDYTKAAELARKSAALNNSHGINSLGILHVYGYGVEKSLEKAKVYFTKAAKLGCTQAIYNLGVLHLGTELSPDMKNLEKAIKYLTAAANRGHALAQHHLAHCYVAGIGVEKDIKKANEFLTYAVEQNCLQAIELLRQVNHEVPANSRV